LELNQAALVLSKENETDMTVVRMVRMLALADQALGASLEVLAMRGQNFTDIVQYGVEAARKMAFLVEQSHDAVQSLSHRSIRESLNQRLESEAAKMLPRAHLYRASGSSRAGNTGSGSSAGVAAADA
jgi:hypothetical protein